MLRVADQAFRTDTGRQRSANEDSFFVRAPIFVVADGMGGAQAGRGRLEGRRRRLRPRPSRRAARAGPAGDDRGRQPRDPRARPRRPIARRDGDDDHRGDRRRRGRGGRRSATSATAAPTGCATGKLERLTRDHSLVEEMRRKGQLTDAQAEDHPQRSIITRALGPEPEVEVDMQTVPAQPGDVFLICSDGLTTMLGEEQIAQLLERRHLDGRRGPRAGRRSQPGRRPRQHHRARLPARRRRRAGRSAHEERDADRRQRPRRRA